MTPFTPTHQHKETKEQFAHAWNSSSTIDTYYSAQGEIRAFKKEFMEPLAPIEEWEPVLGYQVTTD